MVDPAFELVLVTGMSGAGRSTAARALEDLGWFVIDNLPPELLPAAVDHVSASPDVQRLAVVVDVRGGRMFDDLSRALDDVLGSGIDLRVLFLEAGDNELVRRFESSRRPHPLQGSAGILDSLVRERATLGDLRARADLVIDTSSLNVHDLRRKVDAAFGEDDRVQLRATVMSFGFKYGLPLDADIVNDVRFLPNPFWVPELRELSGLDAEVSDYVTELPEAREFLDRMAGMLDLVSDGYLREGKRYVTVAIGCTGGKHRSVAMAENLAARLVKVGVEVLVVHRDLGRE
ncbi:RNase adapter RapZ [Longivirga aurantiaca]|uniref:RNase adapter RapZ n=1 Tax=Longivirga aurantiaca TaxID=1837743 RepID=A0ABW1T2A1_9ACTN